ncbi:MAG: glycosyltransferase, partial [Puniceicoccales bacterium]
GYAVTLNDAHAFREQLGALASDPVLRASMGTRGRAFAVEKFQSGDNADRYLDLFERLLKKRRTAI